MKRVLVFPVGSEPEVRDIGDGTLESMQALVGGGWIQMVPVAPGLDLVCDEEGKLKGLPPNRLVPELGDVICGQFFVSGSDGEGEVRGLSDDEISGLRRRSWPAV